MAAAIFPESISKKLVWDDMSEGLPNKQLRNDMDEGTKVRRKSSGLPSAVVGTVMVTQAEWEQLVYFIDVICDNGVKAFDLNHFMYNNKLVRAAIKPESDETLISRTRHGWDRWKVTINFEVFDDVQV